METMKKQHSLALLSIACLSAAACKAPKISYLEPATGPERTLVEIHGSNRFLASAYWDAGSASEVALTAGFLSADLFTVPRAAALGSHDVQLRNSAGGSNVEPFSVTSPVSYGGAPRLERTSLVGASFSGGQVNTWLYVQVANADSDAEILVDGVVVPTVPHRALRNDLRDVSPDDLNFPIHHWIAFLAAPGSRASGATLQVSCRNRDGLVSNPLPYTLPVDEASMDSDGDDLPDLWEKNGYDADGDGTIDVDLPALGAHTHRSDIFVEVDVMSGLANTPGANVFAAATAGFANAPILNPYQGTNGIGLHLDTSGSVPFSQTVDLEDADDATLGNANFYTLKAANFANATRGRIFHYCIWANAMPPGFSGISDVALNPAQTDFSGPGDDFIVSFDDFSAAFQTVRSMAATFCHELGHNLQQRHGGVDHATKNPTYSSVMSYAWQLRTGKSNATRRAEPVYAPFYYQLAGAVEANGAIPAGVTSALPDYSLGMGRNLVENALSEPVGLYNANAIDWNLDGDTTDPSAARSLTQDNDTNDTAVDFPNWFRLVYSGPRLNGRLGS
jgi:hypothetical protein